MRYSRLKNSALIPVIILVITVVIIQGCRAIRPLRNRTHAEITKTANAPGERSLIEVARSESQWTGVAVSRKGRVFVNYPRWSDDVPFSVGEIIEPGQIIPFPDEEWNNWDGSKPSGNHLVCVQSVYVDEEDNLWILDAASPYLRGVVDGGAKLVKVELKNDTVIEKLSFDETIAPPASYLNDVRVDTEKEVAYITDSGLGAIIVVDLEKGTSRRLLDQHYSTKSENVVLSIGGKEWRINGLVPQVHSDGLALDRGGDFLYYQALTGRTLYRIATRWLLDPSVSERELEFRVESMGQTGAADGIEFGPDGYLYLAAIEDNAINIFASLCKTKTVVKDPRLIWPDSFARAPDGYLYVTASQIHLGTDRTEPYRIFKFKPLR